MSQWGAYGYALHGWTYQRILAHYYRARRSGETRVGTVRVLLAAGERGDAQLDRRLDRDGRRRARR